MQELTKQLGAPRKAKCLGKLEPLYPLFSGTPIHVVMFHEPVKSMGEGMNIKSRLARNNLPPRTVHLFLRNKSEYSHLINIYLNPPQYLYIFLVHVTELYSPQLSTVQVSLSHHAKQLLSPSSQYRSLSVRNLYNSSDTGSIYIYNIFSHNWFLLISCMELHVATVSRIQSL
ncbi:hypothetical protein L211DRAFT_337147 [Terfezia boudieri ATCC MYA-4762]|uniref:Uncharacterized protein n=1 Tax=Terfezia boudieri ATCC MYA-4762 TaxID=1051890 RepID=A0A3N4LHQ3_9PEZI|nr:hypothetical protein L211DRAFT_337147 [Terfezia boudieri ATCC MYA-4762]